MSSFHFCPSSSKQCFYFMMQYHLVLPVCQTVPQRRCHFLFSLRKMNNKNHECRATHQLFKACTPNSPHTHIIAMNTHVHSTETSQETANTRDAINGIVLWRAVTSGWQNLLWKAPGEVPALRQEGWLACLPHTNRDSVVLNWNLELITMSLCLWNRYPVGESSGNVFWFRCGSRRVDLTWK